MGKFLARAEHTDPAQLGVRRLAGGRRLAWCSGMPTWSHPRSAPPWNGWSSGLRVRTDTRRPHCTVERLEIPGTAQSWSGAPGRSRTCDPRI